MATLSHPITADQAQAIACDFLACEWELSSEDQEWFTVLNCRSVDEAWFVVEIGIEGLPDVWFFQVFDTGYCDPNYTFNSPVSPSECTTGLEDMPDRISEVVQFERTSH